MYVEIMPIGSSITSDSLNKLERNSKFNVISEAVAKEKTRPSTSFHAVRESIMGSSNEKKVEGSTNPIPKIDVSELGQQTVTPAAGT